MRSAAVLAFDEPMDKQSVEDNLKVHPVVEVDFNWLDEQNLEVIFPEEEASPIEYIINLQANTKKGQPLVSPINKKFKTNGLAKIDFVTPQ